MSTITISYSSELMSNYMQADTLAPDKKFEALQTVDGHSLLFSIGTDGVFYLTEEVTGEKTGWLRNDLSTALAVNFPDATEVSANTFSVSQSDLDAAYCVVLALTVDGQDHLFLATAYQRDDAGDITVDWQELPFDAPGATAPTTIAGLYTQFTSGAPLIVVDGENPTFGTVDRYYIDAGKVASNTCWNLFAIPADVNASQPIQICGGRKSTGRVDGLYTLGSIGGQQSIIFQELYDPFGGGAGAVSRLYLPEGVAPLSIASTPSATVASTDDATYTDLYVTTSTGDLYYFPADGQADQSQGHYLFNNVLFKDTSALYAYTIQDKVVVWGLDRAQHIFYTQAEAGSVADGNNWSFPLPLGKGIEQVSPYVNRVNGGNAYFAHTGANELKKVFQDPVSSTWQKQNILLPADPNASSQKFDSYTTSITVTDETNAPVSNARLLLSSSFRAPVYINNHYYILDTQPIPVRTDSMGCVTVVQRVETTVAACLYAQSEEEGPVLSINPMDNGVSNVIALNSDDALSNATYTDDKGENPTSLVPDSASSDDISSAATSINSLSDAYAQYTPAGTSVTSSGATAAKRNSNSTAAARISPTGRTTSLMAVDTFGDAIVVAAGDLFDWLESATEYVIDIVEDVAKATWNFVCTIAGKVFTFVIDTIEKVVGAIQAIFQFLETLVKDLIQFMKFLFSWGDIQKTKDVMKNLTLVLLQEALDAAGGIKKDFDNFISEAEQKVQDWGDPNSDPTSTSPSLSQMTTDGGANGSTSASNAFLQYHLVNNISGATMDAGSGDPDETLSSLMDTLVAAIEEEKDIITGALSSFYDEIFKDGQWKEMSLLDLLKLTVSILAEAMLETAENVVDTLFDIIISIADSVISTLATPIWIPVLSDILEEFFDTSIPFSWLDVILLVGALPATMVYKVANGKAPFSDDDGYTDQLLAATSLADIYAVVYGTGAAGTAAAGTAPAEKASTGTASLGTGSTGTASLQMARTVGSTPILQLDVEDDKAPSESQVSIFANCRCMAAVSSGIAALLVLPVNTPGIENLGFFKVCNVVNALAGVTLNGIVNIFAQPAPIKDKATNDINYLLILGLILEKSTFAVYMIKNRNEKAKTETAEMVDAALTVVLQSFMGGVSLVHVVELIRDYDDYPTQANLAFMQIGAQFCGISSASMNFGAAITPEGVTKNVELLASMAAIVVKGVLQFAQAMYGGIAGE